MHIIKIDPDKLDEAFKSFSLDTSNIISFMINEDGDVYKYILKLFLIAGLENYFHIEILQLKCFDNQFSGNPIYEIIRKDSDKKFWCTMFSNLY